MEDIRGRVEEYTPYVMVAIQESERMNMLLAEMKRSLAELDLGLKGDLTMSEPMERLMKAMATDAVPASWRNLAYPSLRPLGSWLQNMLMRTQQLVEWTAELGVPKVVWLSGLFNPQSFLTAVMQTTARRNDWPLDKTVILTEVTKRQPDQVDAPSRDGAFIHGLTLEGCRWDDKVGVLDDSKPKELFCPMPVILVRAVTVDKAEMKDAYQCPVYTTEARFREEVFTAQLKSKHTWIKWTLAGVCMFLDGELSCRRGEGSLRWIILLFRQGSAALSGVFPAALKLLFLLSSLDHVSLDHLSSLDQPFPLAVQLYERERPRSKRTGRIFRK